MKRILSGLLIIVPMSVHSQIEGHGRLISDFLDPNAINPQTFYTIQYKDIAGSPYLEDKSYKGVIVLKDGTRIEDLMLKYNGYEDAVFYEMTGERAALIDPELISGFEYEKDDEKVAFISAVLANNHKNFFQIIYEGKISLYVMHQITLSKKTNKTGGYGSDDLNGAAFKLNDKYFYVNEAGISSAVKLLKKSLLEAIGVKTYSLETYIKENKLKLKDHNDLVKLFLFYESLQ